MFKKKKQYILQTHIQAGFKLNLPFKPAELKQRYGQIELIKLEKLHIAVIQALMKYLYSFHRMLKCFFVK